MAGRAPSPRRPARSRPGARFAIVAARFNEPITKRLLDGALQALDGAGVAARDVELHWVPGAFELPQAALHLARTGRHSQRRHSDRLRPVGARSTAGHALTGTLPQAEVMGLVGVAALLWSAVQPGP